MIVASEEPCEVRGRRRGEHDGVVATLIRAQLILDREDRRCVADRGAFHSQAGVSQLLGGDDAARRSDVRRDLAVGDALRARSDEHERDIGGSRGQLLRPTHEGRNAVRAGGDEEIALHSGLPLVVGCCVATSVQRPACLA